MVSHVMNIHDISVCVCVCVCVCPISSRPTEIGLGLVTFGLGFISLGIVLFFDKGLLAMGNVSNFYSECIYSGTPLMRTPTGRKKVSFIERCPYFRGCKSGTWGDPSGVSLYIEGFHC